jgi:hypothetical protein
MKAYSVEISESMVEVPIDAGPLRVARIVTGLVMVTVSS